MANHSLFNVIREDPKAFILSLALHVVLLVLLSVSVGSFHTPTPKQQSVETVKAVVVDSAAVKAEMDKIKQAEQKKKQNEQARQKRLADKARQAKNKRKQEEKRLADLKRKQAEEKKKREATEKNRVAAEKRRLDEEKKRIAAAEKQRKAEEQQLAEIEKQKKQLEAERQAEQQRLAALQEKRRAEEEAQQREDALKRQQAEELALQQKLAEEERLRSLNSERMQKLRSQYVMLIERHVGNKWIKPASTTNDMYCEVLVTQNRLGDVQSVRTIKCQGDTAFQQSVERAVLKASPLPDPPSPEVFEREIQFIFRPIS